MSNKIPGKAVVRCKFEVHYTLEVPISDIYASDRSIVESLCYQYIFDQRDQDEDGNPTYGLDTEFLRERGIEVVSASCSSDPQPTGRQITTRDWEIKVDEEQAKQEFYGKQLTDEAEAVIRTQVKTIVTLFNLEEEKMERFTIAEILEEINRDRSDEWIPYTEADWQEGWNEWCEGHTHKLLMIKTEESK